MDKMPRYLRKFLEAESEKLHLDKFAEEDIDQCFMEDPEYIFSKEKCFDFTKKNLHRFSPLSIEEPIPDVFECKCGTRNKWSVYTYTVINYLFNKKDEIIKVNFDEDYINYFFDGDLVKAKIAYENDLQIFDKLFILKCKKCGLWYIWC